MIRPLITLWLLVIGSLASSSGATLNANFISAGTVPITASSYSATGNDLALSLSFAPSTGTNFTVINNTGLPFIAGRFSNLAQGQPVSLPYNGKTYKFVANYYGGTGNDLVLQWACQDLAAWGNNGSGQLGNGSSASFSAPMAVVRQSGVLAGKTIIAVSADDSSNSHSLVLCSDGTLAAWGRNSSGQLGNNSTTGSSVPVVVAQNGVLAGKTVVAVSAGSEHTVALCSDGTLAAWGDNYYGQLGNNSTTDSSVPVAVLQGGVLAGKTVIAISAGSGHNLALCSDGTLAAWGWNSSGQLGNNSTTGSSVPVVVTQSGVLAGKTVVAISTGSDHSLALCSEGTLAAWGGNIYGQLGNNSTATASKVPVVVGQSGALAGKTVIAISAGDRHSLALCADGMLAAWGLNDRGQLGNNSTAYNSILPVSVAQNGLLEGKTVAAISAGHFHNLALCSDGTLAAWGGNSDGQLGNNSNEGCSVPVAVMQSGFLAGETAASISTGGDHNLVLANRTPSSDVTLSNLVLHHGALGLPDGGCYRGYVNSSVTSVTLAPTANHANTAISVNGVIVTSGSESQSIPLAVGITAISIGVTAEDGSVMNYQVTVERVQSIDFCYTDPQSPAIHSLDESTGLVANISLGFAPSAGTNLTVIKNTGLALIHGRFNNLAQGQAVFLSYNGKIHKFVANYYGGSGNDLILQWANQDLAAWGDNFNGQLGNNSTTRGNVPMAVTQSGVLAGKTVVTISAGGAHNLALCSDGTVAAWGKNGSGQLGNNSTTDSTVPVAVGQNGVLAGKTVIAIAAGGSHSLALCSDGTLAAWGWNYYGQLGNNSTAASSIPVAVMQSGELAGKTVVAISAGGGHNLALCSDGTLTAWGANGFGELGNDITDSSKVAVRVNQNGCLAGKIVVAISAGGSHSLALCADGTLASWGRNFSGQLGNGNLRNVPIPGVVTPGGELAGKTVIAISAGSGHSLALCSDGVLAAWGRNKYGQLGNNSQTDTTVPVAVTQSGVLAGRTVTTIAAGSEHNLALCSDGMLVAWGSNYNTQLGTNGSPIVSSVPVAVTQNGVLAGKTVNAISAGEIHSIVQVAAQRNCDLSGLTTSTVQLNPVFTPGANTYAGTVISSTTSLTILPVAYDPTAIISINDVAFASGAASASVPLSIGINTITIKVTARDESLANTYTITVNRPSPYEEWTASAFADPADRGNPAVSGLMAIPAGDGITNLMKYAMSLPPLGNGSTDLPKPVRQGDFLTLTYRQNLRATDVTFDLEACDSLTNGWTTVSPTILSQVEMDGYRLITVQDSESIEDHPRRFLRLKVNRIPAD